MSAPLLILLGVSGSGKTSVGRILAEELGVELVEADELVEDLLGAPIGRLVIRRDPRLPDARRRAALDLLEREGVIATLGASQIEDEATLRALREAKSRGARIVELGADISDIARREGLNAPRSVGLGAPRAMLAMMVRDLRAKYADVADSSVETGGAEPRAIAGRILEECRLAGDSQFPRQ